MPPETTPSRSRGEPPPAAPTPALPALIEALLFVSDGPVEPAALARTLNVPRRRVEQAFEPLAESLGDRGLRLQIGPDGVQLITAPEAAPYIEYFLGLEASRRLSNAALETLAIVAYQQPVTRARIESIRGVNSDAAIATLRSRELLADGGRAPGPGRPTLFVTTQRFLEYFGLERPEDLPPLGDLEQPEREAPQPLPGMEATGQPSAQDDGGAPERAEPPAPDASRGEPGPLARDRFFTVREGRDGPGQSLPSSDTAASLPAIEITLPHAAPPPLPGRGGPPELA